MTSDPAIGNVTAGGSKEIGLIINPTTNVPPGVYDDMITILSDNHIPYTYHLQVTVASEAVGSVVFDVLNEFYEDVPGANIMFQHQSLYELIYKATTGADGSVFMHDIPEGKYRYNISATGHRSWSGSFTVEPGSTATVPIALQVNLIDIEWSVTPVLIEDRYEITISQTFKTNVPAPVLVIEPSAINVPLLEVGETFIGEIKVTNYGLINIFDIELEYPEFISGHEIEVYENAIPDKIGAMESFVISFRITRISDSSEPFQTACIYDELNGYGGGDCFDLLDLRVTGKCEVCPDAVVARIGGVMANAIIMLANKVCNPVRDVIEATSDVIFEEGVVNFTRRTYEEIPPIPVLIPIPFCPKKCYECDMTAIGKCIAEDSIQPDTASICVQGCVVPTATFAAATGGVGAGYAAVVFCAECAGNIALSALECTSGDCIEVECE